MNQRLEHGGHEPRTFIAPKDVIEREVTPENEPVTLETRHRIATLAVGLEQVAAHPDQLATFLLKLNDEPIPQAAKARLLDVALAFRGAVNGAEKNAHDLGFDTLDEVAMGKKLFYAMTGFHAGGVVTAMRREGYFMLTCNDQDDFGIAATGGMVHESSSSQYAGGVFHRSFPILTHARRLSIMVMRPSDRWKTILDHERQHWLNDKLFSGFARTEQNISEEPPALEDRQKYQEWLYAVEREPIARELKNEVLAYLRQGRDGMGITHMADSKLYTRLFKSEPERWREVLVRVDEAYSSHLKFLFSDPDDCPILTAQLASIPLERMPEKMKDLGNYYRNRRKLALGERSEDVVEAAGRINSVVHPDIVTITQKLSEQVDAYSASRKIAETAVIGSNGVFVADEELPHFHDAILRAADDVMHTYAELKQKEEVRGAPYPSVDIIRFANDNIGLASIENEEMRNTWRESSQRIGEHIVTMFEKIPLQKLDAAFSEMQQHRVNHRAQKLGDSLAEILHAETGFTFTVDMSMHFDDPPQFYTKITQEPTDKLPKMTYNVRLYCSTTPAN